MTEAEINSIYSLIEGYYNNYLKQFNVKHINLRDNNGKYRKDALVLIYLAQNYPDTRAVSKAELTSFVRGYYSDVTDVQQARHLGKQSGYYIISGTRGNIEYDIPAGHYKLVSLEKPYPDFSPERRVGVDTADFEVLKSSHGHRCAVCGSEEGKPHNFRPGEITKLQAGHMNPSLPLVAGNIIPQCQVCNRPDRNRWIYDRYGRVVGIADFEDGRRAVEKYLANASPDARNYFLQYLTNLSS